MPSNQTGLKSEFTNQITGSTIEFIAFVICSKLMVFISSLA